MPEVGYGGQVLLTVKLHEVLLTQNFAFLRKNLYSLMLDLLLNKCKITKWNSTTILVSRVD